MDFLLVVLRALLAVLVFIGILYSLSLNRRAINWRLVGSGLLLQLAIGLLVLKVEYVTIVFDAVADFFVKILDFTQAGVAFLLTPFGMKEVDGALNNFIFKILPTIIFFSSVSAMLYYFGILQLITKGIAWVMSKTMKLTGAESLGAASNIFIGQTEAPLLIRPYLERMSRSEIICLMTSGFATIAGSVFAAYVGFLGGDDPESKQLFARHLLTASIMNATASIVAAKIMLPEPNEISIEAQKIDIPKEQLGSNVLDAITRGATDGMKLAVNVAVMLLVFTAMIALVNYVLINGVGSWTGLNQYVIDTTAGRFDGFKLEYILGLLFSPIAWLIGVPSQDIMVIGQLLGMKSTINEFYAYAQLPALKASLDPKSVIIATYALCGFANFASIGIQIGGISALAPGQRKNLTELGLRAMIGGTIAAFFTATLAGVVLST
jgi:CNT family concentrative nucleoside transporter